MKTEQSLLPELARRAAAEKKLSAKTANAYLNHIRRFLEFYKDTDLDVDRAEKISTYLEHLKTDGRYAASTLNQARSALMFFYRDVLCQELSARFGEIARATQPDSEHAVLTPGEIVAVLGKMTGAPYLIAALQYGSGLRLAEAVSLRVRDLDFQNDRIVVRDPSTGEHDRDTILPRALVKSLRRHLIRVKMMHEDDCSSGLGKVFLPKNVFRRTPEAATGWDWQYVFPAAKIAHGKSGLAWRFHLAENTVQKALREAIRKVGLPHVGGCSALRYSFAVRLHETNHDAHTIQALLGHKTLKTTMIYLHGRNHAKNGVRSPLDLIAQ